MCSSGRLGCWLGWPVRSHPECGGCCHPCSAFVTKWAPQRRIRRRTLRTIRDGRLHAACGGKKTCYACPWWLIADLRAGRKGKGVVYEDGGVGTVGDRLWRWMADCTQNPRASGVQGRGGAEQRPLSRQRRRRHRRSANEASPALTSTPATNPLPLLTLVCVLRRLCPGQVPRISCPSEFARFHLQEFTTLRVLSRKAATIR